MSVKVLVSVVGQQLDKSIEWPEGWPLPRIDEDVDIKVGDQSNVNVRSIVWFPNGDEENDEPFVYIVLGPRRQL